MIDPYSFFVRGVHLGVKIAIARHRPLATHATDPAIKTQQVTMTFAVDKKEEGIKEDEAEEGKEDVEEGVIRRAPQQPKTTKRNKQ